MIWKIAILVFFTAGLVFADRTIEGRVIVVRDVDTIIVAGTPIRLDGPETSSRIAWEAHA